MEHTYGVLRAIKMGTIENVKLKILGFLMEVKEANAKKLEEKAECANKTFFKARQQLEKNGLIQKLYQKREKGGLEAIYSIPQEKLQTVKLMLERNAFLKNAEQKAESMKNPKAFEFLNAQVLEYESRVEMAVYEVWLNGLTPAILEFINAVNNVFFGNIEKEEDISALKKWGEILTQSYASTLASFKKIYDDLKFHPILEMPIDGNQRIMFDIDAQGLNHYISILNLLESELNGLSFFIKLKLEGQDAVKFFKETFPQDENKEKRIPFLQLDAYLEDIKKTVKYMGTYELHKAKLLELLNELKRRNPQLVQSFRKSKS
jgi:predicted transcriptional regulator